MGSVRTKPRTRAQRAIERIMEEDLERVLAGDTSHYPDGTGFVPIHLATPDAIAGLHAEGRTVVVVDEHGNERFLPAPTRWD